MSGSGDPSFKCRAIPANRDAIADSAERFMYWNVDGDFGEPGCWSTFEKDMCSFSEEYPYTRFEVEIDTGGYLEAYKTWFHDGRLATVKAVVLWPAFSEDMLQYKE